MESSVHGVSSWCADCNRSRPQSQPRLQSRRRGPKIRRFSAAACRVVSLAACVEVEDPEAQPVAGDYLLMTITVQAASAVDAAVAAVDPDTAVVARRAVIPPGVATDDFFRTNETPILIAPGRDQFHPTGVSHRICDIAPAATCLPVDCREPENLDGTVEQIRSFLKQHTPA